MLQCAYAIFCEEASVNTTSKQISASDFFSTLTLDGPGTTKFSFIFGIWGIKTGKSASLELKIELPGNNFYKGKWTSPESKDEIEVYTAIFNCSDLPLKEDGLYIFTIVDTQEKKVVSKRILRVAFNKRGGGAQ